MNRSNFCFTHSAFVFAKYSPETPAEKYATAHNATEKSQLQARWKIGPSSLSWGVLWANFCNIYLRYYDARMGYQRESGAPAKYLAGNGNA